MKKGAGKGTAEEQRKNEDTEEGDLSREKNRIK